MNDIKEGEIFLQEQEDGNWKGWMNKNGTIHEERQGDPETVLKLLLVSP